MWIILLQIWIIHKIKQLIFDLCVFFESYDRNLLLKLWKSFVIKTDSY